MLRQLKDFIIHLFIVFRHRQEEQKLMRGKACVQQEGDPKSAWSTLVGKRMCDDVFST